MSDIVERLRGYANDDHERGCQGRYYVCSCGYDGKRDPLLTDAADEITRLRAKNDLLRAALSNIRHKRREMDMGDLSADEAMWEADATARAALTQGKKQ